jgi:carboxymethylenebutenolidase
MCHDDDSRPPAPPEIGPIANTADLILTAADGNRFAVHEAVPGQPKGVGVVILPDIRGLHPYYRAVADRFAEAGCHAIAMDYFGRTHGAEPRAEGFDWEPALKEVTAEHVYADAGACAQRLRAEHGVRAVLSVGFCFGGGHSWRLASTDLPLAGCVGFYGRVTLLAEVVDAVHTPLLMLLAGADRTPPETFLGLRDQIVARGGTAEAAVYDGAPHSFFDRTAHEWRDACADAWRRILSFAESVTPPA